jgi:hypothetical protein
MKAPVDRDQHGAHDGREYHEQKRHAHDLIHIVQPDGRLQEIA